MVPEQRATKGEHWFRHIRAIAGFSLIELLVVIVVMGILSSMAMQSMVATTGDIRRTKTEREMEMLARAIVGDPGLTQENMRSDFGYVGDVGAFPSNLQALQQNPGSYATWDGPYLAVGFAEDSTGFRNDEWGEAYSYSGGTTIISNGGGLSIIRRIAAATDDYLRNTFHGIVLDAARTAPGTSYDDSVLIVITIPDGGGASTSKSYRPDSSGAFTLDSLPVGRHRLHLIFEPQADTMVRFLTILPRHRGSKTYYLPEACFAIDASAGSTFGDTILVSAAAAATLGGVDFEDEDLARYLGPTDAANLFFDGSALFTGNQDLDAIHLLVNGHLLLSTAGSTTLGGVSFADDDLIDYDPVNDVALLVLDGGSVFTNNADIDAVGVLADGHILLSTDNSESIGSLSFDDEDLVKYDPLTGTASLYLNGGTVFTGSADINSVHVRSDGNIILSATGPSSQIGSLTFGEEDLAFYDPVADTAALYFDGSEYFASLPVDIDAIHIGNGSVCGCWSMAGHWALDESSGTIAYDSSAYGNNGAFTNMSGSEWTTGTVGGGLTLDGSNDHINIGTSPSIIDSLTVLAWVKPATVAIDLQIISSGNNGSVTEWELTTGTADGKVDFRKWDGGAVGVRSTESLVVGDWTHLGGTWDGSDWSIFWNGSLDNTQTASGPVETSRRLFLGAADADGSPIQFWNGNLDDLRLYNCVLTAAQINAIYELGLNIPNLVGHWKLDESSGDTAYDATGNGNHGILTNMAGTEWTTGKVDGALEFDGSSDKVIIPDDDILDDMGKMTISLWAYPQTLDNNPRGPISKRFNNNAQYSYSMFFYSSDRLNVDIDRNNDRFSCPPTFAEGQWYHLVLVYDGSLPNASRVKVYSNNSLIHTALESSSSIPNRNSDLVIGQLNGDANGYFDGLIDDVRLYDRALTPSEIQSLYEMGN